MSLVTVNRLNNVRKTFLKNLLHNILHDNIMLTNSPSYYTYTDKINICPNTTPIRLYITYILKKKKQETPKKIKMY